MPDPVPASALRVSCEPLGAGGDVDIEPAEHPLDHEAQGALGTLELVQGDRIHEGRRPVRVEPELRRRSSCWPSVIWSRFIPASVKSRSIRSRGESATWSRRASSTACRGVIVSIEQMLANGGTSVKR